jgi:hypothetical protein
MGLTNSILNRNPNPNPKSNSQKLLCGGLLSATSFITCIRTFCHLTHHGFLIWTSWIFNIIINKLGIRLRLVFYRRKKKGHFAGKMDFLAKGKGKKSYYTEKSHFKKVILSKKWFSPQKVAFFLYNIMEKKHFLEKMTFLDPKK